MKKSNKLLFVLLIMVINMFSAYSVVTGIMSEKDTQSKEDENVKQARQLAAEGLFQRSIMCFERALENEDTIGIRKQILECYVKGIENGEIERISASDNFVMETMDKHWKESEAYVLAFDYFERKDKLEAMANVLLTARESGVTSTEIKERENRIQGKYIFENLRVTDIGISRENSYCFFDGEKYGILNSDGETVHEAEFELLTSIIDGYAIARKDENIFVMDNEFVRIKYLDKNIEFAYGYGDGLFSCKKGEKYYYYDIEAKQILDSYDFASKFCFNVAAVREGEAWNVINSTGKKLTSTPFEEIKLNALGECSADARIFAKKNGLFYMYDIELQQKSKEGFEDVDLFAGTGNGWAAVKKDGAWGFIDDEGTMKIAPAYEEAKSFSNGLAAVKKDGAWGFINTDNEIIVSGDFQDVGYFSDLNTCYVKKDDFWTLLRIVYPLERGELDEKQ